MKEGAVPQAGVLISLLRFTLLVLTASLPAPPGAPAV